MCQPIVANNFIGLRQLSECLMVYHRDYCTKTKFKYKMKQSNGSSFESLQSRNLGRSSTRNGVINFDGMSSIEQKHFVLKC